MASLKPQFSLLCKGISDVNTYMNVILKGLLANTVNNSKMKLLMLKLVQFSRSNITQLAAGIIEKYPGSCIAPEQMQQIITHNNVLKDFSLLCMCVTDMTGLTADVLKELLFTTESDYTQLKLSLQRLVRYVEDYVIKVAEAIISTIELEDAAEFESAMEEFNHVPIPEEITIMSNKELQDIWFNF